LIASLKSDVASHSSSAKESRDLKKKVQSQTAEISTLQSQIAQLTASVAQTQSENKTLSAKLAANRTAAAENATTKPPGTAVKPNGGIRMLGGTDATAPLKESLYSDLTGLIIRSVKQEDEDDVFDCIQTGRNGSKFSSLYYPGRLLTGNSPSFQACCDKGKLRRCDMFLCSTAGSKSG
jgi:uncharacterized coiled-coil protein SlyX